jgi:hypothetical protein
MVQALANTLWALARLGYPASEPVLLDLSQQLLAQTVKISAQDASSSIWALATLQQQQQQSQEAVAIGTAELQQHVLQLLDKVAAPAVGRANCHSLALALWGTAKLCEAVPQAQLQQLLELCLQHSYAASAQDVSNILYAFAILQQQQQQQQQGDAAATEPYFSSPQQGPLIRPLLQQQQADVLLAAAAARAGAAEPQAIANSLWAVAKMGLQVPMDQLKALVKPFTAFALAGTASTQHLANTLWALATMQAGADTNHQQQQQEVRECVPARVVEVLLAAFRQQLQHSTTQEVCSVLWAAAKLQYCLDCFDQQLLVDHALGKPGVLLATTDSSISNSRVPDPKQQQQQVQLEPQQAANVLWAISTMHQLQKQQQQQQQQADNTELQQLPQQPVLLLLPPLQQQLQQLLSFVLGELHKSRDQEVVSSLWAVARLEPCVLPDGLRSQQMLAALADRVGTMNMQVRGGLAFTQWAS